MVFTDYLENLGYDNYWMAVVISIISIVVVFGILTLIIATCSLVFKTINSIDAKMNILPKEENKILETDKDAVVAALVATIEFNKETGKNAKLVSIKRID
ncbi:MAG: hypothetical protein MSA65_00110 [Mollicutes bacterium]|nr:hypothetical protein [Mollicutes bacterium]MCI7797221.1 hypothetical protein [Mollicutes bacterium]